MGVADRQIRRRRFHHFRADAVCDLPAAIGRHLEHPDIARRDPRWFDDWALLVCWAVGIAVGTAMAVAVNLTPTYSLQFAGYTFPGYTALYTVILNIVVAIVLTLVFNARSAQRTPFDETVAFDYHA